MAADKTRAGTLCGQTRPRRVPPCSTGIHIRIHRRLRRAFRRRGLRRGPFQPAPEPASAGHVVGRSCGPPDHPTGGTRTASPRQPTVWLALTHARRHQERLAERDRTGRQTDGAARVREYRVVLHFISPQLYRTTYGLTPKQLRLYLEVRHRRGHPPLRHALASGKADVATVLGRPRAMHAAVACVCQTVVVGHHPRAESVRPRQGRQWQRCVGRRGRR